MTDVILKTPNVGFSELLINPKANAVLKYFLVGFLFVLIILSADRQITDIPARRPGKGSLPAKLRSREIIMACYKPKNSEQVEAVKAWIQVALNIVDLMDRQNLIKPDVRPHLVSDAPPDK